MNIKTQATQGLIWATYNSAWGKGAVAVSEGRLVRVELPSAFRRTQPSSVQQADRADRIAVEKWAASLESYFRGERLSWSAEEIGIHALGFGQFDAAVYVALLSVPPGTTLSYGTLAQVAGFPRAARAVGNSMASNPMPVVIPCHRVIRADGTMGNYGLDPSWKPRLLEHERASLRSSVAAEGLNRGEPDPLVSEGSL